MVNGKSPALGERPDGRLYSRVTRCSVAILKHVRAGRRFTLAELAEELPNSGRPEFLVADGEDNWKPMSVRRTRDYLNYLSTLGIFVQGDDSKYTVEIAKPTSDASWAQTLSDRACEHLAGLTPADGPPDVVGVFNAAVRSILDEHHIPTLDLVMSEFDIAGTRSQEVFRWSLYMLCDGPRCPLEVRHFPHLVNPQGLED